MEWVGIVLGEVQRLPWTALFGLIVAGVVMGGMVAPLLRMILAAIVDFVWSVHRFTRQRRVRIPVPNDRQPWWRGAA